MEPLPQFGLELCCVLAASKQQRPVSVGRVRRIPACLHLARQGVARYCNSSTGSTNAASRPGFLSIAQAGAANLECTLSQNLLPGYLAAWPGQTLHALARAALFACLDA